jgi:hypothetical protein
VSEPADQTLRTYLESVFGTPLFRFVNSFIELALPPGEQSAKLHRLEPPSEWAVHESLDDGEAHAIGIGSDSSLCGISVSMLRPEPSDSSGTVTCARCLALLLAVEVVSPPGRGVPGFGELIARMDELAKDLELRVTFAKTGKNYRPAVAEPGLQWTSGVGVYSSSRGVEFNLQVFHELGEDAVADDLFDRVRSASGENTEGREWPAVSCASLARDWSRTRGEVMEPYFRARANHPGAV